MAEAPIRILIVDDEAPARHRLRELLDDCAAVLPIMIVGEAQHGREALDILQTVPADLVLTDIHMPGMDGIELARHLLKLSRPPVVIFTTAYHQHALAAFEVHAIDYLVKPVRVQRLLAALQKVPRLKPMTVEKLTQLPAAARRFLSVTERSRVVLVPVDEVVYLKAELKYITIRTAQREYLLEESLTRLEQEFGARFVRVHRNCLVARDFVRGHGGARDLDHRAHVVLEILQVGRREHFLGYFDHNRLLVFELFDIAYQRDHDLGNHFDAFFGDQYGRFKNGPRLHFRNFRVGDTEAAAAMSQHRVEFVQLFHSMEQLRQIFLELARTDAVSRRPLLLFF